MCSSKKEPWVLSTFRVEKALKVYQDIFWDIYTVERWKEKQGNEMSKAQSWI